MGGLMGAGTRWGVKWLPDGCRRQMGTRSRSERCPDVGWWWSQKGAEARWGQGDRQEQGPYGGQGMGPDGSRVQIGEGCGWWALSWTIYPIWYPITYLVPHSPSGTHPISGTLHPIWYPIPDEGYLSGQDWVAWNNINESPKSNSSLLVIYFWCHDQDYFMWNIRPNSYTWNIPFRVAVTDLTENMCTI